MKKQKELPSIQILSEKIVKYVELELRCDKKVQEEITRYGRKLILKDDKELFNYGFIKAPENGVKYLKGRKK